MRKPIPVSADELIDATISVGEALSAKAVAELAALDVADLLNELLDASLSGDYTRIARQIASDFWEEMESGITGVPQFQRYFALLVMRCPALRDPLKKALDEYNPFNDLVPELPEEPAPPADGS